MSNNLWPHQQNGLDILWEAIDNGHKKIVLCSPTGGGKSRMSIEVIKKATSIGWKVSYYTHRKFLAAQTSRVFTEAGLKHGMRASGYERSTLRDIQISMIQTEEARTFKNNHWDLHDASLVFIEEAHANNSEIVAKIIKAHKGSIIIGLTATPVGLGNVYDYIVQAGLNSELRTCGAHIPVLNYNVDTPDMTGVSRSSNQEFSPKEVSSRMMNKTIEGRVISNYERLNPEHRPTILFAPGVRESIFFVDEFEKKGIRAAHIDGKDIYFEGRTYPSEQTAREDIISGVESGDIKVVCSRFILREGIDIPCLYHCIFATSFGSLTGYLQSGGRVIRGFKDMKNALIQDHGGNIDRFGSLNEDRLWNLNDTEKILRTQRKEAQESEQQPIRCPKCTGMRMGGKKCPYCGHEHTRSPRVVIQTDGEMVLIDDAEIKRRKELRKNDPQRQWDSLYFSSRNSKSNRAMSFKQAIALFKKSSGFDVLTHSGNTVIVAPTGEFKVLKNCPPPNSGLWSSKIRDTNRGDLQ